MLATSLYAIYLKAFYLKRFGRIAVHEIMINNSVPTGRENKLHQIYSQMQLNQQKTGMIAQTQSMLKCLKAKSYIKRMRFAASLASRAIKQFRYLIFIIFNQIFYITVY